MADERVLDASAAAAIFFGEPEGPQIMVELSGASLFAPRLIDYEMANIALMKERRGSAPAAALSAGFARFRRLPLTLVTPDFTEVLTLARQSELTAYDASYLWLALKLDAAPASLDQDLLRAWQTVRAAPDDE
jgi:predicted nucleic acid-binding protein